MKKRIIAALAASFALMALASTAGAAITIAQAPAGPGYQNLTPYPNPSGACIGNGGTYSLSDPRPIRLQFGWGAKNEAQMTQFFKYTDGSVSITGADTFSDSWTHNSGTPYLTQQGIQWSALEAGMGTPPGGGGQVTIVSSNYRGTLSIGAGSYTLTQTYVFSRPVQDGFGSNSGTMTNTCTFTVTA